MRRRETALASSSVSSGVQSLPVRRFEGVAIASVALQAVSYDLSGPPPTPRLKASCTRLSNYEQAPE